MRSPTGGCWKIVGGYERFQTPEAQSVFQEDFSLALLSITGQTVAESGFVSWSRLIRLKALGQSRQFALQASLLHCSRTPGLDTSLTEWAVTDAHMVQQTSTASIDMAFSPSTPSLIVDRMPTPPALTTVSNPKLKETTSQIRRKGWLKNKS